MNRIVAAGADEFSQHLRKRFGVGLVVDARRRFSSAFRHAAASGGGAAEGSQDASVLCVTRAVEASGYARARRREGLPGGSASIMVCKA